VVNAKSIFTCIAIGVFAPALLSVPACAHDPQFDITVRLFDYSRTPPGLMAEAQRSADLLFLDAGTQIQWLNCPVAGSKSAAVPACEARSDATSFILIVLPGAMARKLATGPGQFGLAVLPGDGGFANQAYVFLDRAVALAKEGLVPWTPVLGHLIAHELGHLLLGSNSHFPIGIMRASWRSAEIKLALMGNLKFTPEQAKQIHADVQRRQAQKVQRVCRARRCESRTL
jgi:hypothetical protein